MAMWYLVVPPIIVVLSLSFLLWYLSRKGSDPAIAQKVLEGQGQKVSISFPRTKEFLLRILEKSGQRFKVVSLQAHNALHEFTQSVKASRLRVRTSSLSQEAEKKDVPEDVRAMRTASIRVSDEPGEQKAVKGAVSSEALLTTPIIRGERGMTSNTFAVEKPDDVPRPMVSEVATHPEEKKRLIRPITLREEDLIAGIARDPKDFTAYESLGDHYLEMENIKDAKECYRQVLRLSPVHRMVKIKIRRLEKLLTRGGE